MKNLRRKYYACSFETKRKTTYVVQGHLHASPIRGMKFITFAHVDVSRNAWYIIHGVLRFAYHVYKTVVVEDCISGPHNNVGAVRP